VGEALRAADELRKRGVEVGLVDARFVKPLDEELLSAHARRYRLLLTVEEHQRAGGFGSAVLEALARLPDAGARVRVLGVPDRFVDHMTTREEQLAAAGLDAAAIERAVKNALRLSRV
jgi:1-deoxy-D-xylulose-5-phosphate synthase